MRPPGTQTTTTGLEGPKQLIHLSSDWMAQQHLEDHRLRSRPITEQSSILLVRDHAVHKWHVNDVLYVCVGLSYLGCAWVVVKVANGVLNNSVCREYLY
jgi:hypothetical protein